MTKVGIEVEGRLDTATLLRQVNEMGAKIAQANKVTYTPFSDADVKKAERMRDVFKQLLSLNGDLSNRLRKTGQFGLDFQSIDYGKLYSDPKHRARKMREHFDYVTGGGQFGDGGGGSRGPGMFTNIAQAGLRAAGPAGGVASRALGDGVSAGAGAGLMGLLGGLAALGVGKIVSGVMENVGKAEDNNIAFDKLKRTLGDVNVSFNALKTVVRGGADAMKITYGEAAGLAQSFVKQGGGKGSQYGSLGAELGIGVGLSRSFGMDPASGMGFLGAMRGVGMTTNSQESRRIALLIGETIGKSGAFSRAEEVMEAISSFAMSQTRQNMGRANVEGYAGMLSGLVSSGIPGLDPSGAGALLSRVNASLSAGGAKGEASQFFTAIIGESMGLNPYQTQMLREGGAFASNDKMFGNDSVYKRYKGRPGPGGGTTFLDATLARLRSKYGDGSDELAAATAGHLGIGINQAMALLSVKPHQMGELSKQFGDLTKFSGSGILNMAKAKFGTAEDVAGLRASYLGRKDVSEADKQAIRGTASGSSAERELLAKLSSQYEQERTTGSDIRDSKNALDNIKTSLAEKLIPLTQTMRDGIVMLAGKGKSPREISEEVARLEAKDKMQMLPEKDAADSASYRLRAIQKQKEELNLEFRKQYGKFTNNPEEYYRQLKELNEREAAATQAMSKAKGDYTEALRKAQQQLDDDINDIRKGLPVGTTSRARADREATPVAGAGRGFINPPMGGATTPVGASPVAADGANTRGYRNNNPGNIEASIQWQGMTGSDGRFATFSSPEMGYRAMGRNILAYGSRHGLRTIRGIISRWAPPGENDTEAYISRMSQQMGVSPDEELNLRDEATLTRFMQGIARHENGYNRHGNDIVSAGARMAIGTPPPEPVPEGSSSGGQGTSGAAGTAEVTVKVEDARTGKQLSPPQQVQVKIPPARGFGSIGH